MAARLAWRRVLPAAGPATAPGLLRTIGSAAHVISPEQLRGDAVLAELSSLAYGVKGGPAELETRLQAKGLRLVAEGTASFTRWFVAEDETSKLRTLCCRGVSWTHPTHDSLGVLKALLSAWPAPALGAPGVSIHAGVADLAATLGPQVTPWLDGAPAGIRLVGHSLGGSLVQALLARHQASWGGRGLEIVTFGSPPVLIMDRPLPGGGDDGEEDAMLRALGMPIARNYVLGKDPVPGLLLAAKPLLAALGGGRLGGAVGSLLGSVAGAGVSMPLPPPTYQPPGPVFLLRWNQSTGHSVVPLTPADMAAELAVDVDQFRRNPMELMKALMDHQHTNYTQDILAAAANIGTAV